MSDTTELTRVEYEFMEILWQKGEGTVHDILSQLPAERNLAYTSVSTILRILQQKKVLTTRKEGRKHIYIPTFSKQAYAESSLHKLLDNVFSGNSVELVNQLIEHNPLSAEELEKIKLLLSEKSCS